MILIEHRPVAEPTLTMLRTMTIERLAKQQYEFEDQVGSGLGWVGVNYGHLIE